MAFCHFRHYIGRLSFDDTCEFRTRVIRGTSQKVLDGRAWRFAHFDLPATNGGNCDTGDVASGKRSNAVAFGLLDYFVARPGRVRDIGNDFVVNRDKQHHARYERRELGASTDYTGNGRAGC